MTVVMLLVPTQLPLPKLLQHHPFLLYVAPSSSSRPLPSSNYASHLSAPATSAQHNNDYRAASPNLSPPAAKRFHSDANGPSRAPAVPPHNQNRHPGFAAPNAPFPSSSTTHPPAPFSPTPTSASSPAYRQLTARFRYGGSDDDRTTAVCIGRAHWAPDSCAQIHTLFDSLPGSQHMSDRFDLFNDTTEGYIIVSYNGPTAHHYATVLFNTWLSNPPSRYKPPYCLVELGFVTPHDMM